jgi:hypothetical protein
LAILLGLIGLKGTGKDTVAAYLIKEYGYERRAFADKLKQSAAALFGINSAEWETFKNDDNAWISLHAYENLLVSKVTVREFLQRYGTESHRDIFGNNFWVDQVLPVGGYYADRDIVITDVRYPSEADRIKNLKGFVVRVVRGGSKKDRHRSEAGQLEIETDYELDNNGDIKHIPNKVDGMLVELRMRKVMI